MKVFLTGGNGFLGRPLLRRLRREGHAVTALSRSDSSHKTLAALGAEVVPGSLNDLASWETSLSGQDAVVHAAAPVEIWGEWKKLFTEITQATKDLYDACGRHGVGKFVYISSESVLQDRAALLDIDETHPYPAEPNSFYGKAKMMAEQALLESPSSTACVILRPPFLWGPGVKALDEIIQKTLAGRFLWVDHGRASMETAHVENVAEAVGQALKKGEGKKIYFVTDNHPVSVREFLTSLLMTRGIRPPKKNVPRAVAEPIASVLEKVWRVTRLKKPPPLTRFEVAFVSMPRRYNIEKIKNELGYKPVTTLEEGLRRMRNS